MANHKSAAKRAKQTIVKTARNSNTKSSVRTFEKKLRAAIESKDSATAGPLLISFTSKLAKAAQKGVYHSNVVARKVSRLSKQVQSISK